MKDNRKKIKIKVISSGRIVSFGLNIRTPAIVELNPNQIAILKAGGVKFEELPEEIK